jgi:hypothetical protein
MRSSPVLENDRHCRDGAPDLRGRRFNGLPRRQELRFLTHAHEDHPKSIELVSEDAATFVSKLKQGRQAKNLCDGGGVLAKSLF